MSTRLALAKTLISLIPVAAGAADWEKVAETDGIMVYAREIPGSRVRELRAVAEIDAAPRTCWNVVRAYEDYRSTMPYVKESRVVAREEGDRVLYLYSVIDAPLVSQRDYTIRILDESKPDADGGGYKSSWTSANDKGPAAKGGVVRVDVNDGFWAFDALDGGKRTRATYYVLTDPGGSVPAWLANKANNKAVPDVLRGVRKAAKDPKYAAKQR